MLVLLAISTLALAFKIQPVWADGSIYINADGSITPSTASISTFDSVTYTFIGNINESIVLQRNSTVIDGAGYTVKGSGTGTGMSLEFANNVTIRNTSISGFGSGIWLSSSCNNTLSDNTIAGNGLYGIYLNISSGITMSDNNASGNGVGISLDSSSSNTIYHNNFANNTQQTAISGSEPNTWDNGYPSGGNYWSSYTGSDSHSSPYQNETGSDGIDDTPYVLDVNNTDHYPLIAPITSFDAGNWNGTAWSVAVRQQFDCFRRASRPRQQNGQFQRYGPRVYGRILQSDHTKRHRSRPLARKLHGPNEQRAGVVH